LVLIAVSLWMQRGLWGLGEKLWAAVERKRDRASSQARPKGEKA